MKKRPDITWTKVKYPQSAYDRILEESDFNQKQLEFEMNSSARFSDDRSETMEKAHKLAGVDHPSMYNQRAGVHAENYMKVSRKKNFNAVQDLPVVYGSRKGSPELNLWYDKNRDGLIDPKKRGKK